MEIDSKDIANVHKLIEQYEDDRDEILKQIRDVIKYSKKLIYALLNNSEEYNEQLKLLEEAVNRCEAIISSNSLLKNYAAYENALQEYVEGIALYYYFKEKRLVRFEELQKMHDIAPQTYLTGIADFTGELVRHAGNLLISDNYEEAKAIYDALNSLYYYLLELSPRNSSLRSKVDMVRRNIINLENMLFRYKTK